MSNMEFHAVYVIVAATMLLSALLTLLHYPYDTDRAAVPSGHDTSDISAREYYGDAYEESTLVSKGGRFVEDKEYVEKARAHANTAGLLWKKRAFNWALKSVYRTRTTDAFTEFLTYYRADAARTRSAARIELMVHPGAAYAAEESAILDGDWIARTDLPLQLISYAQLS